MGFYSYLTRVPCASPSPLGTKPPRRLLLLLLTLRRRYSQSRLRRARPAHAAPQPALPNAQPFPPALRKWRSGPARPPLAAAAPRTARPWPRDPGAPEGAPRARGSAALSQPREPGPGCSGGTGPAGPGPSCRLCSRLRTASVGNNGVFVPSWQGTFRLSPTESNKGVFVPS